MIIRLSLFLLIMLSSQVARAETITPYLEMVKVSSVSSTWKTVPLDNSYSTPIIVCTHALSSTADNEAVVRVQEIGAGFEIKLQPPLATATITAADVYCTISEEGIYTYPIKYEAHKVISDETNYSGDWAVAKTEVVTPTTSYSNPVVIGQVMSHENDRFSSFWSNNCSARTTPPSSTGICVGKQTGKVTTDLPNEEILGYIIAEEAEYFTESANIKIALGADTIAGVVGTAPYTYDLGREYSLATATIAAMDGGDGGWAVLYGSNPVSQDLNLAIDEETAVNTSNRRHTNEQVAYWAMDPIDTSSPRAELIINEILYSSGTGLQEFVELYATSGGSIENYVVSGQDGTSQNILLPELTVSTGDYVILHFGSGTNNTVGNVHNVYSQASTTVLANTADDVVLFKPSILDVTVLPSGSGIINGVPVDYVAYGSGGSIDPVPTSEAGITVSWNPADGGRLDGSASGQSISLTLNATDTDTSVCWELTTSGDASACSGFLVTHDNDTSPFINSQGQDNNFAPILALEKSVLTIYDPFNGASNPKAIPGSVLEYTITASNSGPAAADSNTIRITDMIPTGTKLCVSNSGFCVPPYFVDGLPSSGLTLGTMVYSTNNGGSYSPSTSPGSDGVDTSITHLSAPTTGDFQPLTDGVASAFSLKFRVKVQ